MRRRKGSPIAFSTWMVAILVPLSACVREARRRASPETADAAGMFRRVGSGREAVGACSASGASEDQKIWFLTCAAAHLDCLSENLKTNQKSSLAMRQSRSLRLGTTLTECSAPRPTRTERAPRKGFPHPLLTRTLDFPSLGHDRRPISPSSSRNPASQACGTSFSVNT